MNTAAFTFKADKRMTGIKRFYSDIQMIGKHFLIYNERKPRVKRQFTICNALEDVQYKRYLEWIEVYKTT